MGKNYRDYSKRRNFNEETVKENITSEVETNRPENPEDPQGLNSISYDYKKEEIDTKGLDANTFAKEYPTGSIKCERLRLRKDPSTKPGNIVGVYEEGTNVTILEDLGEWLSVEVEKNSNKVRGFMMSKFVER
jgi:hypothetical protein